MSAKALNEIDMCISVLRELTAHGQENAAALAEMQRLLKLRGDLIEKMVAERTRQSPPPPAK